MLGRMDLSDSLRRREARVKFFSTRGKAAPIGFSEAVQAGLAPDGGLFVPESLPRFSQKTLSEWSALSWPALSARMLAPFLEGDPLAESLGEVAEAALSFPATLEFLDKKSAVLELFHGPTAAFKDVGARFLAEWTSRLGVYTSKNPGTVLVATSGDTGGAVAAAFHGRPGFRVFILFPKGRISARQEKQLCCWQGNVRALAVRGDFDDCQRIVKQAFLLPDSRSRFRLISANSINLGRILPQTTYYALASLQYFRKTGHEPGFIIPSGNLGNSLAAVWTKKMGFPIRKILLATNANRVAEQYVKTGRWDPQAPSTTIPTLANAMDVGNPSNLERLAMLYESSDIHADIHADLHQELDAISVSDDQIRQTIESGPKRWNHVWCPHTATAVYAREQQDSEHWIIVATAHPAKFDTIVEPLIGHKVDVPEVLARLLDKESSFEEIGPRLEELTERF